MKFAVSEMSFSPPLPSPITYGYWMKLAQSMDGCIKTRNIQWLYSLVSVRGDRSMCVYQVPYAEAIREAYREAGIQFQRLWHGNGTPPIPNPTSDGLVVVVEAEHTSLPKITEADHLTPSALLTCVNRTIPLFTATNIDAVQTHYINSNIPIQRIWQATLIQPLP